MALLTALQSNDVEEASLLAMVGAEANSRDKDGLTVLMISAGTGRAELVRRLLDAGADVHALEPRMGATALHKSAQSGDVGIIALLLDRGAFIDQQSPVLGNTPLMDAILYKREAAVGLLLERGARTNIRNHWQQSPLEVAEADGLFEIVAMIRARKAANDATVGSLSLVDAAKAGDSGKVAKLIAASADVEERTPVIGTLDDDYTPLGIAARSGNLDIVRLLLDAGADVNAPIGLMRGTAVHEASYFGYSDIVRAMLSSRRHPSGLPDADLLASGPYNGLTPLHDAIWHGHLQAARVLIEAGAPLDARTHAGQTPRDLAILYGYEDIARLLATAEAK
jgi:uncharacterized protein